MGLRPGYKLTEVGVIPEDWDEFPLSRLMKFQNGVNAEKSAYGRGFQFINVLEVITKPYLKECDIPGRVSLSKTAAAIYCVVHGDVLFNRTSETQEEIGLASVYIGRDLLVFGGFVIRGRPISDDLSSSFAGYGLRGIYARKQLIARGQGAIRANIGQSDLNKVILPLPPKVEQKAIAEALSDADAFIESLEQLLAKKRQIKQSAMQELLTGKKRLPGFTGNWNVKLVEEFTDCTAGGTPSTRVPEYWGGPIRWMNSGELNLKIVPEVEGRITAEGLRNSSTKVIPENCVLIGLAGQGKTRGTVAMNLVPLCTNQSIAAIFPNASFDSSYLYFNLDSRYDELRELSAGDGGRGGLNLTLIRNLAVPFPLLEEQTAIAAVLSDIDSEIAALEAKLTKARQLKQGMMQELLTGRIRLIHQSAKVVPIRVEQKANPASTQLHNAHFNEAVVLAVLANRFGAEKFPLGRFRRTKFSYLLHRYSEHEAAGFEKKAAGPYNPNTRYGGAEKIALKNGYVREHNNGKAEGFVAAAQIAQAEDYFEKWYGSHVLNWLDQFRYKTNDELELLTTVDMASEDLRREGKETALPAVKAIIRDHPEWKAKLNRATFSDGNISTAIETSKKLFSGDSQSL